MLISVEPAAYWDPSGLVDQEDQEDQARQERGITSERSTVFPV